MTCNGNLEVETARAHAVQARPDDVFTTAEDIVAFDSEVDKKCHEKYQSH
jgi:hypothetical protein